MSNIHTLKSKDEKSDGSDSEDSNERQGFFVGGSEHSGQEVLGPGRNQDGDMVNRLFDAAKNAGAEQLSREEAESLESSSTATRNSSFQGGVYRLGGHGQPSEAIATASQQQNAQSTNPVAIVRLTVWANGLQIDDGPLRPFEDPQNRPLLQSITRGEVPQEIVNRFPGRKVDFQMIRKATEYVPPKVKPFSGEGHRLGAVVPHVVELDSDQSSSNMPGAPNNEEEATKLLADAQEAVNVRSDQPVTRIQVRLPAGQPLVGSFNHGHTVQDLRSFVVTANPALAFQPFQLMTTYPSKVLEDESGTTLQDAGILGSTILLKYV
ncbi:SEP domain-containing protein [Ditylenchus destructor]|uniref:SEP domain-containing protein n=1 Tax=Ditylenchus destructor TaxID=166010 RepID=A0AAD4NJH3_9BILA|nr:SEP domain-containing protein [Ditylenchus destructor]